MCYHPDSDVQTTDSAPDTIPSVPSTTGSYGIELVTGGGRTSVFGDARYPTRRAARAAINAEPDVARLGLAHNYAVAWLGDGDEADHTTEFSIVISPIETVTAHLTVSDGGVDTHLTNSRFPNDPLDRRFDGVTLDEAKARIVAEGESYRAETQLLDQLERILTGRR